MAFALAVAVCVPGCSNHNDARDIPKILNVGVLPDEREETLLKRYTPLFKYISQTIDIPYQFIIAASYDDLLQQFSNGEIDLAYFGGLTFIQAHHDNKAIPLVMRDIDVRFTSYFITNGELPTKAIPDFKGKTFSFGSRLSTSGHLMPRFYLLEKQIIPEKYFADVRYSGSHDKTAVWIRDGVVDAGVANSKIIDAMINDGRLNPNDISIIWETPPYPDYVWALQPSINKHIQTSIRNAFLSLSPANKEHAVILAGMDAGGFLPASVEDFKQLDKIARQSGLLNSFTNLK